MSQSTLSFSSSNATFIDALPVATPVQVITPFSMFVVSTVQTVVSSLTAVRCVLAGLFSTVIFTTSGVVSVKFNRSLSTKISGSKLPAFFL